MKSSKCINLFISLVFIGYSYGQKNVRQKVSSSPDNWTTSNSNVNYSNDIIHLTRTGKKSALLWLNNTDFKNGIIELDIKGKDEQGNSFVGFAFHAADDTNFDAVYFRPFNFKNPKRNSHSIQYINEPNEPWHVLRNQFPKKYENSVSPVPDPNNWFHAKIVVQYPEIKVFVNGAKIPSLQVTQRSQRTSGKLGIWVGSNEGWFKNVVIAKKD